MAKRNTTFEALFSKIGRGERPIALGRVILALVIPLFFWLDPAFSKSNVDIISAVVAAYICYSLFVLAAIWHLRLAGRISGIISQSIDLAVFALFVYLSNGTIGPFIVFFVFLVSAAATRWDGRGALCTTAVSMGVVLAIVLFDPGHADRPIIAQDGLTVWTIYLAVVGLFFWYVNGHEVRQRRNFFRLAAWPVPSPDVPTAVTELLKHAAWVLRSPRMLLCWVAGEEPWLHVRFWDGSSVRSYEQARSVYGNLVTEALQGSSFICRDAGASNPVSLYVAENSTRKWRGTALNEELQKRFAIGTVLALPISTENLKGYLFALDKSKLTPDDLILGGIAADEIIMRLTQSYLVNQLRLNAVNEERVRLARDLHDGLLQSLTVAALQLESVSQLVENHPERARDQITAVQGLILAEQRDLRQHIHSLRPSASRQSGLERPLADRLSDLVKRIERHWGLLASIDIEQNGTPLRPGFDREVYFMVHESMINAARHARATSVHGKIAIDDRTVNVVVTDDGRGFPFLGRYDHSQLEERALGPRSLRERASGLGGSLTIESSENGSMLEIILPIKEEFNAH